MSSATRTTPAQSLDYCLEFFNSVKVTELSEYYDFFPNASSRTVVGKGAYAVAYKVKRKSVRSQGVEEPIRVVKELDRDKLLESELYVQHFCAELAILRMPEEFQHVNLNRAVELFHNDKNIFVVLEIPESFRPSVLTRIAQVVCSRRLESVPEISKFHQQFKDSAKSDGVGPADEQAFGDYVDERSLVVKLARKLELAKTEETLARKLELAKTEETLARERSRVLKLVPQRVLAKEEELDRELELGAKEKDLARELGAKEEELARALGAKEKELARKLVAYEEQLARELGAKEEELDRALVTKQNVRFEVPYQCDLEKLTTAYGVNNLPESMVKIIAFQMLEALKELHQLQITHRDVKPANIVVGLERKAQVDLVDSGGSLKIYEKLHIQLIDFGFVKFMTLGKVNHQPDYRARALGPNDNEAFNKNANSAGAYARALNGSSSTQQASYYDQPYNVANTYWANTPAFVSEEILSEMRRCRVEDEKLTSKQQQGCQKFVVTSTALEKLDVFGLGVTIYYLLNGKCPWFPKQPSRSESEKYDKIRSMQLNDGLTFHHLCSKPADDFIRRLLDLDPNRRPTVAEALQHPFLAGVNDRSILVTEVPVGSQFRNWNEAMRLISVVDSNSNTKKEAKAVEKFLFQDTTENGSLGSNVLDLVGEKSGEETEAVMLEQRSNFDVILAAAASAAEEKEDADDKKN